MLSLQALKKKFFLYIPCVPFETIIAYCMDVGHATLTYLSYANNVSWHVYDVSVTCHDAFISCLLGLVYNILHLCCLI